MSLHSHRAAIKFSAFEITTYALEAALLIASKQAMSGLPNIEPVTILLVVYTTVIGWKALIPAYVFVMSQYLIYGFSIWSVSYLYIWGLLVAGVMLFRRIKHSVFWVAYCAVYGLAFGALTAIPTLFMFSPAAALAWWINGLSFDLLHCIGNGVMAAVLFYPLRKALILAYSGARTRLGVSKMPSKSA